MELCSYRRPVRWFQLRDVSELRRTGAWNMGSGARYQMGSHRMGWDQILHCTGGGAGIFFHFKLALTALVCAVYSITRVHSEGSFSLRPPTHHSWGTLPSISIAGRVQRSHTNYLTEVYSLRGAVKRQRYEIAFIFRVEILSHVHLSSIFSLANFVEAPRLFGKLPEQACSAIDLWRTRLRWSERWYAITWARSSPRCYRPSETNLYCTNIHNKSVLFYERISSPIAMVFGGPAILASIQSCHSLGSATARITFHSKWQSRYHIRLPAIFFVVFFAPSTPEIFQLARFIQKNFANIMHQDTYCIDI